MLLEQGSSLLCQMSLLEVLSVVNKDPPHWFQNTKVTLLSSMGWAARSQSQLSPLSVQVRGSTHLDRCGTKFLCQPLPMSSVVDVQG